MPQKRTLSLRRCYGIFFLALTILLGCAFLLQATDLYFGALDARAEAVAKVKAEAAANGWSESLTKIKLAVAENSIPIYSREEVGRRLKELLPYICVWLAAVVAGIVIAVRCPMSTPPKKDPDVMLGEKVKAARRRIPQQPKADRESDFQAAVDRCTALKKQEMWLGIVLAVLSVACLVLPLLYFADFSHFPATDISGEVSAAALYALPFVAVLLAGGIGYIYLQHSLLKKESDALKAAVAAGARKEKQSRKKSPALLIARCALLVIGLALFVMGTQNGSMQEVFIKATKICTECIGLG